MLFLGGDERETLTDVLCHGAREKEPPNFGGRGAFCKGFPGGGLRAAAGVIKVNRWCVRSRDFGGVVWVAVNERTVWAAQESFCGRHQRATTGAMR